MTDEIRTGGCQCGAMRNTFSARPDNPGICHCRMCHEQFGSFFGPFAGSDRASFSVTRGSLADFQSSDDARRRFCRNRGTPLTFEGLTGTRISVSIGSPDRYAEMKPVVQYGAEVMEPWLHEVLAIPETGTADDDNPTPYARVKSTNHQHPDHDTARWP